MSCKCNDTTNPEEVFGCEINLLNKPFLNNPSVNDLLYIFDRTDNTCKATSLEKIADVWRTHPVPLHTGGKIARTALKRIKEWGKYNIKRTFSFPHNNQTNEINIKNNLGKNNDLVKIDCIAQCKCICKYQK